MIFRVEEVGGSACSIHCRKEDMKSTRTSLWFFIAVSAVFAGMAFAETVVIDFEDLTGVYQAIPDGYGGIAQWSSWVTFDLVDPNYPPHSGVRRAYCFGNGTSIEFGTEYVFESVWISGPVGPPDEKVYCNLYLNDVLVHTTDSIPPTTTPTLLQSGYNQPVDEIRIWHDAAGNMYTIDDFAYSTITPVARSTWATIKALIR
jgi:hypothetical protein